MSKVTKSTTLEGYFATGDHECFCFDVHRDPAEHQKARGSGRGNPCDDCRTYPGDLIPEGTEGKKGRWTITVEFEPYESGSN